MAAAAPALLLPASWVATETYCLEVPQAPLRTIITLSGQAGCQSERLPCPSPAESAAWRLRGPCRPKVQAHRPAEAVTTPVHWQ